MEEEAKSRQLEERLQSTEQLLREKESAHADQVNTSVCVDKDFYVNAFAE